MSEPIISIKDLGKKYQLGLMHEDFIANKLLNSLKRLVTKKTKFQSAREEIWALKDISFDVNPGEVVGIIGRNGAGKSTLLKILSRITDPTVGEIRVRGNVASLLEVGTGFHPELTGRENIYLNGAILGMTKREIERKFDEIVAFAEIEKFVETPVKRYSSGMYVRLAFSVAAHLEPEILVVDEVLAVGDHEFQSKCLGKMREVSKLGRTVLFVSHNMAAVSQLCSRGVLLKDGKVDRVGGIHEVISAYLSTGTERTPIVDLTNYNLREGSGILRFDSVSVLGKDGVAEQDFNIGEDIRLKIEVSTLKAIEIARLSIIITTSDGIRLCNMVDIDSGFEFIEPESRETLDVTLRDVRLYPETYHVSLWAGDLSGRETYDKVEDCISIHIVSGGTLTNRSLPRQSGLLFWTPEWRRTTSR